MDDYDNPYHLDKYDYLEAESPLQPRQYLQDAATAMVQTWDVKGRRVTAYNLRNAGVSVSEWISKLYAYCEELEQRIEELEKHNP